MLERKFYETNLLNYIFNFVENAVKGETLNALGKSFFQEMITHLGEGGGDGAEEEHGEGHDGGDGGDQDCRQLLLLLQGGQVGEINPESCGEGCTLYQSSVTFKLERGSTQVAN